MLKFIKKLERNNKLKRGHKKMDLDRFSGLFMKEFNFEKAKNYPVQENRVVIKTETNRDLNLNLLITNLISLSIN